MQVEDAQNWMLRLNRKIDLKKNVMHACVVHVQMGKGEGNPAIREEKCVFLSSPPAMSEGLGLAVTVSSAKRIGMKGRDRGGGLREASLLFHLLVAGPSADIYKPLVGAQREESEDMEETAWDTI